MSVGSESMIERVKVAALCAYVENGGRADIGEHLTHGDMRHVAPDMIGKMMTAALQALMEPTPGMVAAPVILQWEWRDGEQVSEQDVIDTWQAMIRSAMEEG